MDEYCRYDSLVHVVLEFDLVSCGYAFLTVSESLNMPDSSVKLK